MLLMKRIKKVQPGDSIVLANQIWKDAELKFKGNGTQESSYSPDCTDTGNV